MDGLFAVFFQTVVVVEEKVYHWNLEKRVEVVRDFFWSGGLFSSFLFDLCFMRVCSADGLGFSECLRTIIK